MLHIHELRGVTSCRRLATPTNRTRPGGNRSPSSSPTSEQPGAHEEQLTARRLRKKWPPRRCFPLHGPQVRDQDESEESADVIGKTVIPVLRGRGNAASSGGVISSVVSHRCAWCLLTKQLPIKSKVTDCKYQ